MTDSRRNPEPRGVHIDTDPGLDDLLALGLALASPEIRVAGITTVAGNASLEAVTRNAAGFLALARTALPLGRGAAGPLGTGGLPAVHAQQVHGMDGRGGLELPPSVAPEARALEVFRGSVERDGVDTLLALGPLTNVAQWLEREPALFEGLRIVWMGGTRGRGNVSEVAEFNAFADPEALARVLASGVSISIVGLEVTRHIRVRPDAPGVRALGAGRLGRFLEGAVSALAHSEAARGGGAFATLHDPCAVAALLVARRFEFEDCSLSVEITEGKDRGRLTTHRYARDDDPAPRHRYARHVDARAVEDLILERLAALAQRCARADA